MLNVNASKASPKIEAATPPLHGHTRLGKKRSHTPERLRLTRPFHETPPWAHQMRKKNTTPLLSLLDSLRALLDSASLSWTLRGLSAGSPRLSAGLLGRPAPLRHGPLHRPRTSCCSIISWARTSCCSIISWARTSCCSIISWARTSCCSRSKVRSKVKSKVKVESAGQK